MMMMIMMMMIMMIIYEDGDDDIDDVTGGSPVLQSQRGLDPLCHQPTADMTNCGEQMIMMINTQG